MQSLTQHMVLTEFDHNRLRGLLQILRARGHADSLGLDAVEHELGRAQVVPPDRVPSDFVTMNSVVGLHDLESGLRFSLTLVFPGTAAEESCVPVLSPLGIALLGRRVGDVLRWDTPRGAQRLSVDSVHYQPEAAGHFFL
jgi:regulator of nucleoside diphosphate kinase